jgi:signal transduction histidine kinase
MWYAPLRRIVKTAERIASGDLSYRTGMADQNKLADLAKALSEMRDHLGEYLGQIAAQHQDLQTVLASLQEGVLATDVEGHVVLMNQAAGSLLSLEPREAFGKRLSSILSSSEMLDLHDQALSAESPVSRSCQISTAHGIRRLDVRAAHVVPGPSNIRCVLVIRPTA